MREIKEIIIHCSDTYHDMDIGVDEIRKWHLARRFKDVGYQFVIRRDGTIEKGREIKENGAHCIGHNAISIGVCFVGGKEGHGGVADNFTIEQMQIGSMLLEDLHRQFPNATFHGHNEFSNKNCPVFDISRITPGTKEPEYV